jgi:hypothetical protein
MKSKINILILILTALLMGMGPAFAAKDFNIKNNSQSFFYVNGSTGNIGVGTTTSQTLLSVVGGNVGIGTWTAAGGNLIVNGGGNVGIGSAWPGVALDVQGTIRANFLQGDGHLITGLTSSQWITALSPNDVYLPNSGNVGIGTTITNAGSALTVMNGNVGIGTWVPGNPLVVNGAATINGIIVSNYDSTSNTIVGSSVGSGIGGSNTVLGAGALQFPVANVTGITAIGNGALNFAGGNYNTALGSGAGFGLSSVSDTENIAIGYLSMYVNNAGHAVSYNVAVGDGSLKGAYNSAYNVALGYNSMATSVYGTGSQVNVNNNYDVAVGDYSLYNIYKGNYNVAIGHNAGYPGGANGTQNGSDNIWLGANAGPSGTSDVSNSVGIGSYATAGANNVMVLGGRGNYALNVGIGTDMNGAKGSLIVLASGNSNGNVGIGSVIPGQALDVQGTIRSTGFTMTGQTPVSGYVLTASDSSGDATWSSAGGVSGWTITNTTDVYETSNGNVGIGSTSPSANLDIATSYSTTGFPLRVRNSGYYNAYFQGTNPNNQTSFYMDNDRGSFSSYGGFLYGGSTSSLGNLFGTSRADKLFMFADGASNLGMYVGTLAAQPFIIGTNDLERVRIDSSGNVGIGTAVPGAKLELTSSGGAGTGMSLRLTGASSYVPIDFNTPSGLGGQFVLTGNGFSSGAFGGDELALASELTSGVLHLASIGSSGIIEFTTGGNSTANERMRITSAGNVGIGSINPGQALDVQGRVRTTNFTMTGQTPVSGYVLTASDSGGDTTWTSAGGVSGWTITNTTDVYETSGGNVGIGTTKTTTSALSVMNGNVGIGTWVPQSALAVIGQTTISDGTASGNAHPLKLYSSGGNGFVANDNTVQLNGQTVQIVTATTTQFSGGNVGIGTTTPLGGLVVMSGNVGIGTWVPNAPMAVNGTVDTSPVNIISSRWNTGDYIGLSFGSNSNNAVPKGAILFSDSDPIVTGAWGLGDLIFAINNSASTTVVGSSDEKMRITVNGNVGIGTAKPSGGLIVMNGNVGIGTWVPTLPLSVIGDTFHNGNVGIGTTLTSTSSLAVMNGNVGVGTWVPAQMLDVKGTIRTTNFTMTGQTPVSGYVLTASDSGGDTTWTSAGGVSGWTITNTTDVYETSSGNVGIGTTITTAGAALTVMNGNVGIGTWVPVKPFSVIGDTYHGGNIGIGTTFIGSVGEGALTVMRGNVGIGTWVPAHLLQVGNSYMTSNSVGDAQNETFNITSGIFNTASYAIAMNASSANGTGAPGGMLQINGTYNPASGTNNWDGLNVATTLNETGSFTGISRLVNISPTITSAYDPRLLEVSGVINHLLTGQGLTEVKGTMLDQQTYNVGISTTIAYASTLEIAGPPIAGTNTSFSNVFSLWDKSGTAILGGNLGVGTTSAANTQGLSVLGGVSIGSYATIAAPAGGVIVSGNVGIGTLTAAGGNLIVNGGGNVGIGSAWPGQALDINGTVRAMAFIGNGAQLTGLTSSQWSTTNTNDVYLPNSGNVGIGTTITSAGAALTVMNGNVGIGTWVPSANLTVQSSSSGGTPLKLLGAASQSGDYLDVNNSSGTTLFLVSQYGGVGSADVSSYGTVTADSASELYVYQNGSGGTSRKALRINSESGQVGNLFQWENNSNILGEITSAGNIGIGTTTPVGALTVMNGNVGIGTWVPASNLSIAGPEGGNLLSVGKAFTYPSGVVTIDAGAPAGTVVPALNLGATSGSTAGNGVALNFTTGSAANGFTPNASVSAVQDSGFNASMYFSLYNGGGPYERMRITAPGNVGIGTVNPGQMLDVQGTVRALQFMGDGSQLTGIATFSWVDVSGTTLTMAASTGYIADNASLVTMTLPATAAVGSQINVTGGVSGAGLWKIAQNAGQTIHFGSVNTTAGTGGYLSASGQYDSVQLICIKANTDFVVVSSQGNINYN